MKLKIQLLSCLVLAGTLLALPVLAIDGNDQATVGNAIVADELIAIAPAEGSPREEFFKSLGLTDAQLEKIGTYRDNLCVSTAAKKAEMMSLHHQMAKLMTEATINRAQVTALADKMNVIKTDLSKARVAFMLDTAEVMTPDQRAMIRHRMLEHEFKAGGMHHGGGQWQHHGGHGPGGMHHPGMCK